MATEAPEGRDLLFSMHSARTNVSGMLSTSEAFVESLGKLFADANGHPRTEKPNLADLVLSFATWFPVFQRIVMYVTSPASRMQKIVLVDCRQESISRCVMQDIFWGVVIIAIGIVMGGSVFLGEFSMFNIFFDGLGVFFIGKGAISMMGAKEEPTATPAQPAAMQSVESNEGAVESVE